jgi:transcriptional regulator with XRE-family HTH domain
LLVEVNAELIAKLRTDKLISMRELGRRAKISAETVSKIESGEHGRVQDYTVRALGEGLGVDPRSLLKSSSSQPISVPPGEGQTEAALSKVQRLYEEGWIRRLTLVTSGHETIAEILPNFLGERMAEDLLRELPPAGDPSRPIRIYAGEGKDLDGRGVTLRVVAELSSPTISGKEDS